MVVFVASNGFARKGPGFATSVQSSASGSTEDADDRLRGRTSRGDAAARAERIHPGVRPSPVPGQEHVRGFGVMSLPFDSGHVLALRVFPQNDFAPYVSIWHRTPEGRWSIYVDGPRLDTACPRYFGAAAVSSSPAEIDHEWTGPMSLRFEMRSPELEASVALGRPLAARTMNLVAPRVPTSLWRRPRVARTLARVADLVLDVGDVTLAGTAPNGQASVLMPRTMYPIVEASAVLEGKDLGHVTRPEVSPRIGEMALPARPMLAIGEAYFQIADPQEYERTRAELAARQHAP